MTYAASNTFSKKVASDSEPSGKGVSLGGNFASKIASGAASKGEPSKSGGLSAPKISTKGNARKA